MTTALPDTAVARLEASDDPRAQLVWRLISHYLDVYEPIIGRRTCVLHDPLAVALALDPTLATYRLVRASIELRGTHSRGQVVADLRRFDLAPTDPRLPGVIRIVESLDLARFHNNFLAALGA